MPVFAASWRLSLWCVKARQWPHRCTWNQAIASGPRGPAPANPHTPHIRRIFLRQKMKFIKGAGYLKPVSGTQTFLGL